MVDKKVCPFCLQPYDDIFDLVADTLAIDKVFIHYDDMDEFLRICPLLGSDDIEAIVVNEEHRTVELKLRREK